MIEMKKFGLAAIVAAGLSASILGVASPGSAVASAEVLPVMELPGYSTGVDHRQWIDTIQPRVTVPQVDTSVHQGR